MGNSNQAAQTTPSSNKRTRNRAESFGIPICFRLKRKHTLSMPLPKCNPFCCLRFRWIPRDALRAAPTI